MKVTLFLNHRCNLRCGYCYTGRKFHRAMPLATARRAIDFALERSTDGWLLVALFGGEPLLEIALAEQALAYAAQRCRQTGVRLFTTLATNGTLIDQRRLTLLRAHGFHVQVSLDGSRRSHDACRRFANGRSSHERTVAGLRRLMAEGFTPWVLSVVDPANAALVAESFDFLVDLGARHVHLSPNYFAEWDEPARARFEEGLEALGDRYLAATRAGREVHLDPVHGKIVTHLVPGSARSVACKFGKGDVAVAPSGRLYPCERLVGEDDRPDLQIGDLEHGLDEARVEALLARRERPEPECDGCDLRDRCKHWCGCANFETTGDPGRVSPIVCYFERCFYARDRLPIQPH
jgi:uncharacterized protein